MAAVLAKKSKLDEEREELLNALAAVGGRLTAEEDVVYQGKKLVVPENMNMHDAVKFLGDKIEEDERIMQFSRTYKYRPWDGAHATMAALREVFGMVQQHGVKQMFGTSPPQMMTINVGPHETAQVPWGNLSVPLMPGVMFLVGATKHKELGQLFSITASGPRKYRYEIEGVFNLVQRQLEEHSIYKGRAFDGQEMPEFIDTDGFDETRVVYARDVLEQLNANIWSLMMYSDTMRQNKIPLKRATLFEGPYGCGKTLGAYMTAKIAVASDWTFLYCRPGRDDLAEVMATARLYQPSCVFFEDVDNIAAGDVPGADTVSALLDIFDGINAKNTEIMVVLTTNHAERIHKGMVRPGRLDAVIHIGAPDADGVQRFIEIAVPDQLRDPGIDYAKVGAAMEGFFPAFITESIDRAKRYNIAHNDGVPSLLTTDDFVEAANGLRPQLALMEDAPETPPVESLDAAFDRVVRQTADTVFSERLLTTSIKGINSNHHGHFELETVKDGEVVA
jgi:transitional endoplasmic reticulum ATPase